MILEVLTYPNKKLWEISKPVSIFDKKLHILLDNMYETMIAKNGIGLAAIQVGKAKNILLINLLDENDEQKKENLLEIINPQIIEKSGSSIYQEGCLSVPGFYAEVERFEKITLKYQDRFSNEKILKADGLLSIAIQHETDHLLGHLFIEKLSYLKRKKFEKEYKKKLRSAS